MGNEVADYAGEYSRSALYKKCVHSTHDIYMRLHPL
jgi:hypothetical protein